MKKLLLCVGVLVLAFFSVVIWPTRFRTETGAINGTSVTLRTDRFSGEVEYLTPQGWKKAAELGSTAGLSQKTIDILNGH